MEEVEDGNVEQHRPSKQKHKTRALRKQLMNIQLMDWTELNELIHLHDGVLESFRGVVALKRELWSAVKRQTSEREPESQSPERVARSRVWVETEEKETRFKY